MFSSESPSDVVVINGISVLLTLLRERWAWCGGHCLELVACVSLFILCSVPATEYGVMPPVVSDTIKSEVIPSPGMYHVLYMCMCMVHVYA